MTGTTPAPAGAPTVTADAATEPKPECIWCHATMAEDDVYYQTAMGGRVCVTCYTRFGIGRPEDARNVETCVDCGAVVARTKMISRDGEWVCARCADAYPQMMGTHVLCEGEGRDYVSAVVVSADDYMREVAEQDAATDMDDSYAYRIGTRDQLLALRLMRDTYLRLAARAIEAQEAGNDQRFERYMHEAEGVAKAAGFVWELMQGWDARDRLSPMREINPYHLDPETWGMATQGEWT